MTALAYTLAPEPELDFFEGDEVFAPRSLAVTRRPELRLVPAVPVDRVKTPSLAELTPAKTTTRAIKDAPNQGLAGRRRARPASSPASQTVAQLAAQSASQLAARRATQLDQQVAAQPVTSVEVYRRRQFMVLAAVSVLVLGLAWAAGVSVLSFGPAALPADDPITAAAPAVHVVLPGESYAAIAAELGAADPVSAGEQLRVANGGSELVIGQRLLIDLATITHSA